MSSRGGTQTNNVDGQVVSVFAISNGGPDAVEFTVGIETSPGFVKLGSAVAQQIFPGKELVITLYVAPPSRAVVICQREKFVPGWRGKAKDILNSYLFHKHNMEIVYASPCRAAKCHQRRAFPFD